MEIITVYKYKIEQHKQHNIITNEHHYSFRDLNTQFVRCSLDTTLDVTLVGHIYQ